MGDEKNMSDAGCNKWGHDNGHSVVEFVVNKSMWYHTCLLYTSHSAGTCTGEQYAGKGKKV